ncbi:glutathione S-transferase N-terminal domain-containing protein [Serratia fonticola]|uniref:glutathione binding-like protein n=1 Tax=Serratia fonticola TaxID=47917 RepID=UPI0015C688FB|nr:glutathione binding-like protein [Serratia fonticola]MBC3381642.1 glutathione S-transferase N-terminal domain-containing protein [Serratia fonticola]NYA40841.1 glutathione S-transferase N-terminal domain-containing protein [Serratia fonticola]
MLSVWGRKNSFNVQKVMWLIGELGLQYHLIPFGGQFGDCDTEEFAVINPTRHIPVIDLDRQVVWESHTILRFLAAGSHFWLDDPRKRANVECWMDWCQTTLEPDLMMGVFWGLIRTPEAERDWPTLHDKVARCSRHFQVLETILSRQPFLSGDSFGLADIPTGATLYRYFSLDIKRPTLPAVEAWYQRLQNRPAYREHVMVPYDDLRGQRIRL